jgi:hypothetical protein
VSIGLGRPAGLHLQTEMRFAGAGKVTTGRQKESSIGIARPQRLKPEAFAASDGTA